MKIYLTIAIPRISIVTIVCFVAFFTMNVSANNLIEKIVEDPVIKRGLVHFKQGRRLTADATDYANQLLSTRSYRLVTSWQADKKGESKPIQVYSVYSESNDLLIPAAVPRGCRCIFVNTKSLHIWSDKNSSGEGRMELDEVYLLAYMLLHEVGHIDQGSSAVEFVNGQASQLNIAPSLAKKKEEDADKFAADLVQSYSRSVNGSDASLTANWIANEISKMSWNMQAYRTLDEFGSSVTGKPSVYFDGSYSHPNLAWRILRINHLIQNSSVTQDLLKNFEELREIGANPMPLYKSDP